MLKRFPGPASSTPTNVPDLPYTMHLDTYLRRRWVTRGFDGSMQRISWFGHLVTNWMATTLPQEPERLPLQPLSCGRDVVAWPGRGKDEASSSVELELWGDTTRRAHSNGRQQSCSKPRGKPFAYR